jgi:hypothetical protein
VAYTIGFGMRNKPEVSTAQTVTAKEALELAEAPQRSDKTCSTTTRCSPPRRSLPSVST